MFAVMILPVASVTETVTATATQIGVTTLTVDLTATATPTDAYSAAGSVYNPTITESVATQDSLIVTGIFYVLIAESIAAGDSFLGRLLWELIDDTETANWQNIVNTQSSGWTIIDDTETGSNWTDIKTI